MAKFARRRSERRTTLQAWSLAAAFTLGMAASGVVVRAQTPPNFSSPVTVYIGTNTGGGYDLYGRLVARHLGRFLPGHPNVIASNMPGAGAVIMANWLYNVAPKDGSAIGLVPTATAYDNLLGNQNAHYDATKFNWLGSLNGYTAVAVVWGTSPYQNAQDFLTKPVIIGAGGAASDVTIWPKLVNSLLDGKLKIIPGYIGTSEINLAMEKGEVEGYVGNDWDSLKFAKPDWLRDGKVRVVLQLVSRRHSELADVPTALEFVSDPDRKAVLKIFLDRQQYGRPFAAPPGVFPANVEALRQAFSTMAKDEAFLAEAKQLGAPIDFAPESEIQSQTLRIYATPKPILARATEELQNASH